MPAGRFGAVRVTPNTQFPPRSARRSAIKPGGSTSPFLADTILAKTGTTAAKKINPVVQEKLGLDGALEHRSFLTEKNAEREEILSLRKTVQAGSGDKTTTLTTGNGLIAERLRELDTELAEASQKRNPFNQPGPPLRSGLSGIDQRFATASEPVTTTAQLQQQVGRDIRHAEKEDEITKSVAAQLRPRSRDVQAINDLVFRGLRKRRGSNAVPRSVALLGSARGDRQIL